MDSLFLLQQQGDDGDVRDPIGYMPADDDEPDEVKDEWILSEKAKITEEYKAQRDAVLLKCDQDTALINSEQKQYKAALKKQFKDYERDANNKLRDVDDKCAEQLRTLLCESEQRHDGLDEKIEANKAKAVAKESRKRKADEACVSACGGAGGSDGLVQAVKTAQRGLAVAEY